MKIAFYTLGCKANQFDTQALESLSREHGHTVVSFEDIADTYVINTCTVTAVSDKKSRQMVRHIRRNHPQAIVAVCGCFAQLKPDEAQALEADVVAGANDRRHFLELVERAYTERTFIREIPEYRKGMPFESLPAGGLVNHTRALLKVEDGCDHYCTYCIIPYARGHVRSMPLSEAEAEAARLSREGYREVVLTGIEISSYGLDLQNNITIVDLIEHVCKAAGTMRVHLGSLEPRVITDDFCRRLAALPNLCSHFHLSLQSGCDATLRRMRRRYYTARYLESVELLKRYFDNCSLTTDLIVGFPGETEEEFGKTLEFIKACGFAQMHIFPYSKRIGTPASAFPDQIPRAIREQRAREASAAAAHMRRAFLERQLGHSFAVLFESDDNGVASGYSSHYIQVCVPSVELRRGKLLETRIISCTEDELIGELM